MAATPDRLGVERRYAWLIALAVVTGILGATGNVLFRGAIVGATWVLSRSDLIAAHNRTVATLSASAIPAWIRSAEQLSSDAYRVMVAEVPESWVGRTLREIDCRARYGVAVLAVRRAGDAYELPDPDRRIVPEDVLVLAGSVDALRRARAA